MRVDKRRFLTWIPVVLLLFSLSACKTSEKRREKKKIKIGITLYDSHDTFITGYMSVRMAMRWMFSVTMRREVSPCKMSR